MSYTMFKRKKEAVDKGYLVSAISLMSKNLEEIGKDWEVYRVTKFGRLLEVQAYYHETDEHYCCVGFEVEVESQFIFDNGKEKVLTDLDTDIGFYAIWTGKCHPDAPMTFEESSRPFGFAHRFDNGLGDHVLVLNELASEEETQRVARKLASSYLAKNSSAS